MKTLDIFYNFVYHTKGNFSTGNKSVNLRDFRLYSYNALIAFYDTTVGLIVLDKTARGKMFISMTTSNHIGKLIRFLKSNCIFFNLLDIH